MKVYLDQLPLHNQEEIRKSETKTNSRKRILKRITRVSWSPRFEVENQKRRIRIRV